MLKSQAKQLKSDAKQPWSEQHWMYFPNIFPIVANYFLNPKKTLETSICKPICMQLFYAFVSAFFSLNKVLMSPICGPLFSLRNHSGANLPHPFNVWYIFNFVKLFENTQWTPTNIKHPFNVWYIFSFAKQQQNYFVLVKQQSHKTWEGHQKQNQHVLGFG